MLIAAWLAAGAIGGPYFGRIGEVSSNDQASYLPASADATEVSELLPEFAGSDDIPAIVVAERDGGLTDADLDALGALADDLAGVEGVGDGVSPPIESDDGEAVQLIVPIAGDVDETIAEINAVLADLPSGLTTHVTGPAGFTADLVSAFAGIDGLLLLVALGAVFVILIIVYRSPLLPRARARHRGVRAQPRDPRGVVAREGRRRADQRTGAGHPVHPRDRCRDRLRAALRLAIPRGAARPRQGGGMRRGPPSADRSSPSPRVPAP